MFSSKDYSKLTLDELVAEEKKLKLLKFIITLSAVLLLGFLVWSATHDGGPYSFFLMIFLVLIGTKKSKNLEGIQAEISSRDTAR